MSLFWRRLSQRERILVVLTLIVLAVFVIKYAIVSPIANRRTWVKSQLESQPELLAKNLRYLGQKDAILAGLESARAQIQAQEPKLLSGDTASVSASDLQETVQAMAAREGTQVITTRVLNPEPAGSVSKIGLQLEIGGQIHQVVNLIKSIESSPKLLMIDEINVRSLFRPVGFPQPPGLAQAPAQNLRISLMVSGYARAKAAPAKAGISATPGQTDS
jgi:ACT domain-containing protein